MEPEGLHREAQCEVYQGPMIASSRTNPCADLTDTWTKRVGCLMDSCDAHEMQLRMPVVNGLRVRARRLSADDLQRMELGSPAGTSQQGRASCCRTSPENALLRWGEDMADGGYTQLD